MKQSAQSERNVSRFECYSDIAVRHFMSPKNTGRIENASGCGCTSSMSLEDFLSLSIRVNEELRIEAVRCRASGSSAAVACGSVFTEMILGMSVRDASRLSVNDIVVALCGLPHRRVYAAELPIIALKAAIEDYRARERLGSFRQARRHFVYRKPGSAQIADEKLGFVSSVPPV